jgi:hypothetical protein
LTFSACSHGENEYRQNINGNIISPDGVEYVFLASETEYVTFGEYSFISYIKGQPRKLGHGDGNTDAGVYSVYNDPNLTILYRVNYNSEWSDYYIKKDLLKNNLSFENCCSFKFIKTENGWFDRYWPDIYYLTSDVGIYEENIVNNFINDMESKKILDENYFSIFKSPPGTLFNDDFLFLGYIYGFFKNIPNLALPGEVYKGSDNLYYLTIKSNVYIIDINWLIKLGFLNN